MDFEEILNQIKNNTASFLDIERRKLTDQNISDLSDALINNTSVCGLTLSNNPTAETANVVISDGQLKPIFEAIRSHPNLSYINVQNNNMTDEGAGYAADLLKNNGNITTFNLSGNNFSKVGATALSQALDLTQGSKCNLSQLHLNNVSSLGDDGAVAIAAGLAKNNEINTVHLNGSQIGSIGIKALALALEQDTNKTNSLNLNGNIMDDEGAEAILHALKVKPIIAAVDVSDNNISDTNIQNINKILAESAQERQDLRDLTKLQDQLPATGANDKLDDPTLKVVETKSQLPTPVNDTSLAPAETVADAANKVNQTSAKVVNDVAVPNVSNVVAEKTAAVMLTTNQAVDIVNQAPNKVGETINDALPTNQQIMNLVDNTKDSITPTENQVINQTTGIPITVEQTIDNTVSVTKDSAQATIHDSVPPIPPPSTPSQIMGVTNDAHTQLD